MGKIIFICTVFTLYIYADGAAINEKMLQNNCLACHQKQQIPSSLIYKRYLMKYSTKSKMEEAIFKYLKNPKKKNSIMPPQFFLKFPMKEKMMLDDAILRRQIKAYLEKFDVRKYLKVKQ